MKRQLTSPVTAMSVAYVYIGLIATILWSTGFYKGNNFFNWGPPINFFNHTVTSQNQFYAMHVLIFFHQLVNNWVNTVVYPWIINEIQDSKAKDLRYGTTCSLLLINFFNLYSEIDVMVILMGFTSQISFLLTVTLANIISSTIVNHQHIIEKTKGPHSPLLNTSEMV